MDLSKLVQNEDLFPLDIKIPGTDKLLGLKMMVRSAGSEAAMKVVRRQTDDGLSRAQRKILPDAEWVEKTEIEQAASYVASWQWSDGADWKGTTPDCTPEIVAEVFREAPWIYAQVVGAARDIANFTKA